MLRAFRSLFGSHFSPRLKTQLTASFMGMTFVVLVICTAASYLTVVRIVDRQAYQTNLAQLRQLEINVASFQNEVDKIMRLLIVSMGSRQQFERITTFDLATVERVKGIYADFSQMLNNYEYIESIYWYGDDRSVLGVTSRQNVYVPPRDKRPAFFRAAIDGIMANPASRVRWRGGTTSAEFVLPGDLSVAGARPVRFITATRTVNYLGALTGVLVVNVNERYFASIYGGVVPRADGARYVLDEAGTIVSHSDATLVGSAAPVAEQIAATGTGFGAIAFRRGGQSYQGVFQRFADSGWVMVNEIPRYLLLSDVRSARNTMLLLFAIGLLTALGMSLYWIYRITRPLDRLREAMRDMETGLLGGTLAESPGNELGILGRQFNAMSQSIVRLVERIRVIEEEKRALEIASLQWQINPHFLYNTLSTIKHMALLVRADNVARSITTLGLILEPVYRDSGELCSLRDELEYVKNYVRIMNYRYGEGITLEIEVPEDLAACRTLRFLLQPIVENAIQHGLCATRGRGLITIGARREGDAMTIVVHDDGEGMDETRLEVVRRKLIGDAQETGAGRRGIGLANVQRRIALHFGAPHGLVVESRKGEGTRVSLRLPLVQSS